jgi:aldehyde:ferredoxin oxidoreductase
MRQPYATAELGIRPRVIEVDLCDVERDRSPQAQAREWRGSSAAVDRVGRLGGAALASALLYESARVQPDSEAPLVLAIGECVRRGTPTAARITVASRSPLTGRLADGQVGSDLARRLATVADALVLRGRTDVRGAVLELGDRGEFRLHSWPELEGLSPREVHARATQRFGACASLSIGIAGERELPFASLAAGGSVPHFVGRGGLGAVMGRLGLKALVVTCEPVEQAGAEELIGALRSSPRLAERALGGTLELFSAFGASEQLRARNYAAEVSHETAAQVAAEVASSQSARHGCQGCPTPCGWVFDRGRERQGARFGASYALGLNLGLERFDDALALLADCDELGVDAKEVGAMLALFARATELGRVERGPKWGDVASMRAAVRELVQVGAPRGSRALAHQLGLERELFHAKQSSVRPDANLATLLGQCVSSRGTDPMRTFSFLVDSANRVQLERMLGMPLPEGADDPRAPAGKGRIVWWHENLAAALDATGFCSFSSAALLADGSLDLDRLTRWLAPDSMRERSDFERAPARAFVEAGADVVALQRELDELWNGAPRGELPEWARPQLEQPGMWDEYAALRGLDSRGALTSDARERFSRGEHSASADRTAAESPQRARSSDSHERRAGRIVVRSSGELAAALGREREVTAMLPAVAAEILAELARASRDVEHLLLRDGRILPALYRGGRRVLASDELRDGDTLELVLVVGGG